MIVNSFGLITSSSLLAIALAIGAAYSYGRNSSGDIQPQPAIISLGPTTEHLTAMKHLVVLKLVVGDVLEGNKYGYRGAWLVSGDAMYQVDMADAEVLSKDEDRKSAVVRLSPPRVEHPRVDHNKTMTYSIERTSWIPWTGDESKLRDESMKEAQAMIERAATKPDYLNAAKANGELVVKSIYSMVDWDVSVQWKPSESQPRPLPDSAGN